MHSCTAAQIQPKVIFFGLLCFPFSPYSCKLCILALAKILPPDIIRVKTIKGRLLLKYDFLSVLYLSVGLFAFYIAPRYNLFFFFMGISAEKVSLCMYSEAVQKL